MVLPVKKKKKTIFFFEKKTKVLKNILRNNSKSIVLSIKSFTFMKIVLFISKYSFKVRLGACGISYIEFGVSDVLS